MRRRTVNRGAARRRATWASSSLHDGLPYAPIRSHLFHLWFLFFSFLFSFSFPTVFLILFLFISFFFLLYVVSFCWPWTSPVALQSAPLGYLAPLLVGCATCGPRPFVGASCPFFFFTKPPDNSTKKPFPTYTTLNKMQKAKVYAVVGSNIEQLGTELERKCKETAAATETEVHRCLVSAIHCGPTVSRLAYSLYIFCVRSISTAVAQDWQGAWPAHLESRKLQGGASASQDLRPLLRGRLLHRAQRTQASQRTHYFFFFYFWSSTNLCRTFFDVGGGYIQTHGRPGSLLYDVHFWLGDSTTLVRPPPLTQTASTCSTCV
jgi:hypothetical protein